MLTLLCGGVAMAVAEKPAVPATTGSIENFEVPEHDEHGNLKWKLSGERAQFTADGQLSVTNLRAEFYTSNQVALVFSAPQCTLDRFNRRGHTDAPVRLERPNVVVTGTGADWVAESSSFVVHSNVQVVISAPAPQPPPPAQEPTE